MGVSYVRLHPYLKAIVKELRSRARTENLTYRVTSAYRSPSAQAKLYAEYLAGVSPYPVAPPGSSLHEQGLALDVVSNDQARLARLLTSWGLTWGGQSDPVHFTLGGPQIAKQRPLKAYAAEVGTKIPVALDYLPGFGPIFRIMADPGRVLKERSSALLSAVLGPL